MVGYFSCIPFHDFEFSMVVEFTCFWVLLMIFIGLMSLHDFPTPQKLTKWVILVVTLVDPKPRLCHPNKGFSV
jgi:hypothetical protein